MPGQGARTRTDIGRWWRSGLLCLLLLSLPFGARAQDSPFSEFRASLPGWLEIDPELRVRSEHRRGNAFEIDVEDGVLTRAYLGIGLRPHRRFRVYVKGMDARMLTIDRERLTERYRDVFDVRQAYVEIGDPNEDAWRLIAGRQLLSYGSERLIAPANWSNSRRAFDAVRLRHEDDTARVDVFSGSVVSDFRETPDQSDYGNGFHGVYSTWKKWIPNAEVDTYLLYRTRRRVTDELGARGDSDLWAPGVRVAGALEPGWDYELEAVLQRGQYGQSDISAWSLAAQLGHRFTEAVWQPRLHTLYLRASGDSDPNDGKFGAYDQFFPANHKHRGLVDVIGYRNLDNWNFGIEGKPVRKLSINFLFSVYRLASRNDGYYTFNGRLRVAPGPGGAASRGIGNEFDLSAGFKLDSATTLSAGIGWFERGDFLRANSSIESSTFGYVSVEFRP